LNTGLLDSGCGAFEAQSQRVVLERLGRQPMEHTVKFKGRAIGAMGRERERNACVQAMIDIAT